MTWAIVFKHIVEKGHLHLRQPVSSTVHWQPVQWFEVFFLFFVLNKTQVAAFWMSRTQSAEYHRKRTILQVTKACNYCKAIFLNDQKAPVTRIICLHKRKKKSVVNVDRCVKTREIIYCSGRLQSPTTDCCTCAALLHWMYNCSFMFLYTGIYVINSSICTQFFKSIAVHLLALCFSTFTAAFK